jgi:hypothetical protein
LVDGTLLTGTVTEVRQLGFAVSLRFAIDHGVVPLELWVEVSIQSHRSLDLARGQRHQILIPRDAVHLMLRPTPRQEPLAIQ